jgi:LCP family protein required for cell wall assembly
LLGMRGGLIAGKVGYTASCLLAAAVLVVSGYAYKVTGFVSGIATSNAVTGGAQTGAMNILVMGLESRTNYQGQTIDHHLQFVMHVGSVGGQATNTLILIHIFAGGQRAVGISIPRDDWVTFPKPYDGQSQGKIDQAYGFAYYQYLNDTPASSMSSSQRYFRANEAGQKAAIDTVEMVTNQKVDHFAEVNLAGFYALAGSFGGIEACIKPWTAGNDQNLADQNSGWNAVAAGYNVKKGGSQYLHLTAAQALAFVRDRDSLPNGDLSRTSRQQAVLDYVIWKLKHGGIITDVGALTALLGSAKNYLITDSDWHLLNFATQMTALTGQNMKFYTAPIAGPATIDGQDVNQIDVPTIQADVKAKFTAPAPAAKKSTGKAKPKKKATPVPPASTVTVDVYNGSTATTAPLAGQTSAALVALGYKAGAVQVASAQSQTVTAGTQVFYGAGASANAEKIAKDFGATAKALTSLRAGHVEVLLGTGATVVPASLTAGSTPASTPSTHPSASASAGNNGASGGAVTVKANAKYGIPCVY